MAGENEGAVLEPEVSEAAPNEEVDTSEVEAQARQMGWRPKEEFSGDEEEFIDAAEFVRRGNEVLPIVRADNKRLRKELAERAARHEQEMEDIRSQISDFNKITRSNTVESAKTRRTEISGLIKQAREDGDVQRELELTEEFNELGNVVKAVISDNTPVTTRKRVRAQPHPDFEEWKAENSWYEENEDMTAYATAIGERIKASNPSLKGRAFLDKVSERVNKLFGDNLNRNQPSKVAGGRGSGESSTRTSNGRSYTDLPADAKSVCDRQESRFVGPTKLFKNQADYRKNYVAQYFSKG